MTTATIGTPAFRFVASLFAAAVLVAGCHTADFPRQESYYAAWTGALSDATRTLPGTPAASAETFDNQTVRHALRLSPGGDAVRLRVSTPAPIVP